mgnify:CR=1 FL=1
MRHLELFAGIGGFRRAMDLLTQDHIMNFHCIGYSEIDAKAVKTYCANFHPEADGEVALGDIVEFTSNVGNITSLPGFDLLTGGFPCQTFSMMGKQAGFNEDRGQMFFRILDILRERRPRYVLLENVKNLRNHDKGRTFLRIKAELEALGYSVFIAQLIAELEQGLRRLAGAYIAACLQVGKTLDEGLVHLALLLLLAPALGVLGQHEQCREGAQCRIADGKRGQQRQQQHVQRDIDAVG